MQARAPATCCVVFAGVGNGAGAADSNDDGDNDDDTVPGVAGFLEQAEVLDGHHHPQAISTHHPFCGRRRSHGHRRRSSWAR